MRILQLFSFVCFCLVHLNANAQVSYSIKIETGYIFYVNNIVQIDPGPNWKGYNLYQQNGIDVNCINGISLKNKLFIGFGVGYLNFEGINGISLFSDLEYLPLKSKLSPIVNLKIGYTHLWNQYQNGTGSDLGEFGLGVNYKINPETSVFLKFGLMLTQQSLLYPLRLGLRL